MGGAGKESMCSSLAQLESYSSIYREGRHVLCDYLMTSPAACFRNRMGIEADLVSV